MMATTNYFVPRASVSYLVTVVEFYFSVLVKIR